MRVISPKMLREFSALHSDAESPLERWYDIATHAEWKSFEDIRADFARRVDRYRQFAVFDIGGNKYRLIAAIHYNTGRVYIRHVLTHADYDRGKWKEE
jgi:mRNA interferase HigB